MSEAFTVEWHQPPPIDVIVNEHLRDGKLHRSAMIAALRQREETLADFFRLAAATFGMYPEIVAKALMDSGIGEPMSDEQQQFIQQNFINLMDRLRREHGQ